MLVNLGFSANCACLLACGSGAVLPGRHPALEAVMIEDGDSNLWSDFDDEPSVSMQSSASMDSSLDIIADVEWDEPTGEERPPEGLIVESVVMHLPLLMQCKYGNDWELLLADSNFQMEADMNMVNMDGERDQDHVPATTSGSHAQKNIARTSLSESKDREQVAGSKIEALRHGDDETDIDEVDTRQLSDGDVLVRTPPELSTEETGESLSPRLTEFITRWREGDIRIPAPFPASEWQHIFVTAVTQTARYMELRATWANLVRVCDMLLQLFCSLTSMSFPGTRVGAQLPACP